MLFLKKKLGNRGNRNRILFKLRKKLKIHHLKKRQKFLFPEDGKVQKQDSPFYSKTIDGKALWPIGIIDKLVDCISLENRNTSQPSDATQSSNRESLFEDIGANIRLRLIDSEIIEFQRQFVRDNSSGFKFISMYKIRKKKKIDMFFFHSTFYKYKCHKREKQKFHFYCHIKKKIL